MNNIYTYISSNGVQKAIGRSLVALLGCHLKAVLLFVCFAFFAVSAPAHAQVTLSGTIYTDAGSTPDGTVRTINVAVGTTTPGVFASTSMVTTGAYTVTIPVGSGIATGTPILVWIDGGAVLGSVVTKASSTYPGANITGLDVYHNRLITRHEGTSATSTTINDLAFYTIGQDVDVTHATTSNGEIVVRSGVELYVWGGDTFAPGGAITVAGNAGAGATEGSMTMGASSVYIASSTLRLAGSLTVPSSATFNAGSSTIFFVATTTGKTISAPVTSIGNVTFVGSGGGWSFSSSATTSSLTILAGSVTAPSSALAVQGTYQNYGSFNNNGGTMTIIGAPTIPTGNFPAFTTSLDVSGSAAGTGNLQINTLAVSSNGRTLYAGNAGSSAGGCNPTAGSATTCEMLVIDIANPAAPALVTGRDAAGNIGGGTNVGMNNFLVVGNYLYVAKNGSATACAQSSSTASGCELMVFDISSTTNPEFVAGRDMDGTATGIQNIAATSLAAKGTSLYVAKAASGATACSTTALNCELMVFDISSTTNPTYQTGLDTSGSAGGTQTLAINSVSVVGDLLVAGKAGSATACSQTAGSAVGCELMVFDISSTTNPVYVAGRDVTGDNTGVGNLAVTFVTGTGTVAYVGKAANATACSQTAGSALGCEVMVFDISSTTNPLYTRGVDIAGSPTGQQSNQVNNIQVAGKYLYVSNSGNATVCEDNTGLSIGCELTVFDVSSSTALKLVRGRDASGSSNGILSITHTAAVVVGNILFVSRAGSATACSQTAGSTGAAACELAAFSLTNQLSGVLIGNMSGSSALGHLIATGTVEFRDVATTSNLTVSAGTTTFPSMLTVTGNFQNNGNLVLLESTLQLDSASAQSIGGNLISNNELYTLRLSGSGAKTFTSNASTTFLTIDTGSSATFPSYLSVRDTYQNSGTVTANASTLNTAGFAGGFLSGVSAGGSATDILSVNVNGLLRVGSFVFVTKANNNTACSQTAGSAVGCELMVFNIEAGTSPSYRAGRDVSGSAAGTGNIAMNQMAVSTNNQTLYVAKSGDATACSQTAGSAIGCELMVFDIASTTAPSYVAGRDTSGDSTGVGNLAINNLLVVGNYLYVAKAGNTTACSQTAGSAIGCELMVFDISSTTNPVYVAGRDMDGTATGIQNIAATSLAAKGTSLYVAKAASGATACSTTALNCELMVFDISSTTNPTYQTGLDTSGSAGGTQTLAINSVSVVGDLLVAGKAGSATACSQTAGSAVGCELMVFDVSSTTNPTFVSSRDTSGNSAGTGNLAINFVTGTGTVAYVGKAANATACSQTAGSALGCEVMVFDISSTSSPTYVRGLDSSFETDGELSLAVQTVLPATSSLMIGRAGNAIPCEQTWNLRLGCELVLLKMPTTLSGTMVGSSQLGNLTTYGQTEMTATASTTNLTIGSSSVLTVAPAPLSIAGSFINGGQYRGNLTPVTFTGTNIQILGTGTTTFYDLIQNATAAATTSFSGGARYVILRNVSLQGLSTSTPLRLQSNITGIQWRIDPWSSSTATFKYLAVSDANNVSTATTPIICSPGCADRGNNTNWTLGSIVTITGVVYGDYGSTPLAGSVPVRLVVGSESPTAFSTSTTAGTGAYSFSVTETLLSTSTKYVVYVDNDASNKASLLNKGGSTGVSLTGLDLYKNFVIFKHETTNGTVTGADAAFYDGVDDTDIPYRYATNQLETNAGTSLVVWDNTQFSPNTNVVINSNGTGALNDGNLFIRSGGSYIAGGDTTIGSSLRASSTASYIPGSYTTNFVATTTGQVIDQRFASLGNVAFSGGGAWTFSQASATTTDLKIDQGTVTAPSDTLAVQGIYRNYGTFTNNSGTVYAQGTTTTSVLSTIATYSAGADGSGSLSGTDAVAGNASVLVGNYLYVVKAGSATACAQSAGSATGCELLVFDVSNPASPVFVAGRDASGDSTGVANVAMSFIAAGNGYLFIAKAGNATACSQTAGSAIGCELMVFDISSSTNPTFVAGRDASGDSVGVGGSGINYLALIGNYVYTAKSGSATACSQTAGSAIGCELMVFDISNPTSPIYVAGRDITGDSTGVGNLAINALVIKRSSLYIAKAGNTTACSQTVGSATGCELMVFDISSSTNPVYVAGRDASGDSTGILSVNMTRLGYAGNSLYASKAANATACSQTAGSAVGCELMVFDIASTTNPTYVAGRDAGGDTAGTVSLAANSVAIADNYLYVSKAADAGACSQIAGSAAGCELMVYDIASTTNPTYIVGRDASGSSAGTGSVGINQVAPVGDYLYIAKAADATACSQTAGSAIGCELMVFTEGTQPSGLLSGLLTNTNKFGTLRTKNLVYANNNGTTTYATTTNLVIDSGSTFTAPTNFTITGDYTNNGTYTSSVSTSTVWFSGTTAQNISGNSSSPNYFKNVIFTGSGAKAVSLNASSTSLTIESGVTVNHANNFEVSGDYTNNGTFTGDATSNVILGDYLLGNYDVGRDITGNSSGTGLVSHNAMVASGDYLYAGTAGDATACSQTAGSAIGCELQVYDISSTTNPTYVAGRDASGDGSGTGNVAIREMVISGNYLYLVKAGDTTACSQTAGSAIGCELMVFDISTPVNPVYVAGRDASGNSSGTDTTSGDSLVIGGNYLYVAKGGDATACSQTAGSAVGCEIQVYDISSSTNPVYVAGRDIDGAAAGTGSIGPVAVAVSNNALYVGKPETADNTACSQVAGFAIGCELLVFNVSDPTNPTYVAGRAGEGSANGAGNFLSYLDLAVSGNYLYTVTGGTATACSQTAGSARGCEIQVFDISSSTNPLYVAGRDSDASSNGGNDAGAAKVAIYGNYMIVGNGANATACSQISGSALGCELQVYDISYPGNPIYLAGRDGDGSTTGTSPVGFNDFVVAKNYLYLGKNADATACSQTAGSAIGCELMGFQVGRTVVGDTAGVSSYGTVTAKGAVRWVNTATTTNVALQSGSAFVAPTSTLYVYGNFTNAGFFDANNGTVTLNGKNQTLTSAATTTFYNLTQTATTAATTTFSTTGGWQINNNLTLRGSGAEQLALRSAVDGVQWTLLPLGSTSVSYVNVKDSRNSSSTIINCTGTCTDSGNNTNWTFPSTSYATATVSFQDGVNSYTGTRDTYILSTTPTTAYGSTDPIVVDGSPEHVGLIKWDISSIPSNAVVTGVTVEVNVTNESDGPYELYQALQPWTENATWLTYDGSNAWGGVGATSTSLDRGTTVYGAINLGSGGTGVETITFGSEGLALVQSWVDGSVTNNGFVIQDFVTTNGVQFNSRENATASNRPRFTVSYYTGTPPTPGAAVWNSTDWTQYDTITVDATKVDAELTDFPVYVNLGDLSTDFWTTTPTSSALVGTDIRVTNSSNVELPRELVFASSTLQSGELHFKADSISSTTDTTFKIWYNGTTAGDYATNATYGAEQVWTNNYLAVYHMQDDPTGTTTDSTSNGFDGGPGGSAQASGAVGSAVNFGGGSRIDVTNFTSYLTSFSAESWVRPTALENTGNLYTIIDLKDALYWAIRDTDESVRFGSNWGSYYNWTTATSTVVDDAYQHLYVGMSDLGDTATDPVMINNGTILSQGDNTPSGSHQQSTTNLYIGSAPGFDSFTGDIDELRISSTTRSTAWVQAMYYNQATTTDFYAVNYIPPSAGVPATAVFQEGVNGYSGTTDTSIADNAPTINYGTQNFLDIDGDAPETTGFIKWDISSIPSNATIDAAEIVLYNTDPGDDYEFYESIRAWTEGGATWNTYNGTNNWTTAGAKDVGTDIAGTVLGTFSGAGTGFATSTLNSSGIALLQDWVDGTKTNYGFAIQDHVAVSGISPESSEAAITQRRPKLVVSYTIPSTATINAHTAGQVANAFDFRNKTDAPLFAFNLTPVNGTGTVTNTVLKLSGVQKLDAGDFSNIRLVRDHDHDAIYDVSDEAVGGSGTVLINGETGTITFTGDFLATTTTDYLVVGDFNAPANGTFVTISLPVSGLTVLDVASGIELVDGTVASVQHSRNNQSGGGVSGGAGDPAPSGAGNAGGGGNQGGEVIGNDPDYLWPSSQSGSWTSGASAYDQVDGTYATTNGVANHQYANHSFAVPGSNTIQGIIIRLELSGTTGAGTVDVQLSWDGGTSWTGVKSTPTLGTGDVVYTLGSPSDLWGRSWSVGDFSNANFAVRVIGNPSSNTVRLDAIQARVYHIAGGGGGGGGGEI